MGGGAWTSASAVNYVTTAYSAYNAKSLDDLAKLNVSQVYQAVRIDPQLDPKGVIRECRRLRLILRLMGLFTKALEPDPSDILFVHL